MSKMSANNYTVPELDLNQAQADDQWLIHDYEEGQLAIDVYQTPGAIIVKSTIAGATASDVEISLHDDLLTIRGQRHSGEQASDDDYLYRECYWGRFARSIILPTEVLADKVQATMTNGVLRVVLPKARKNKQVVVKVRED